MDIMEYPGVFWENDLSTYLVVLFVIFTHTSFS